jgi:hypothetical protein
VRTKTPGNIASELRVPERVMLFCLASGTVGSALTSPTRRLNTCSCVASLTATRDRLVSS